MLRHTFCHIPGVGEKTERSLWGAGVTSWASALEPRPDLPPLARVLPEPHLRESLRHYEARDPAWFGGGLPARQSWRLFHDFRDSCAYLDIETTGMPGFGHITTIALYDGRTIRTYIHGDNLGDFARDVQDYRLLVTYNGKSFDVPFIERGLGVRLGQAHVDLRHVLRALGLKGGLKSCERQLGMTRPGMEEVDGFVAVLLWHEYRRTNDRRALESLLAYNIQDAVNLETLMVHAHNSKLADLAELPFAADYLLPVPTAPANPYQVDEATVQRVLRDYPLPRPFVP
jgi:uncharacterized protein YprB with RNaseH-like and TPR domain